MPAAAIREFRVHARHIDRHHGHVVKETSFEAAAVAYLEDYLRRGGGSSARSVHPVVEPSRTRNTFSRRVLGLARTNSMGCAFDPSRR